MSLSRREAVVSRSAAMLMTATIIAAGTAPQALAGTPAPAPAPGHAPPPARPSGSPADQGDPLQRLVATKAGRLTLAPRCRDGETVTGTVTVALAARGMPRLGWTPFSCRAGRLATASIRSIALPRKLWRQARTRRGFTLAATIRRRGEARDVTMPLQVSARGGSASHPRARAASWVGLTSSYCQGIAASGGGGATWYIDIAQDLTFGANYGDWVQVYAYGQLYGGGVYGSWQRSTNTITYQARPGGAGAAYDTPDGIVVTSTSLGVGPMLQWNYHNGFSIPQGHHGHIAVYAWTKYSGWRWDWATVDSTTWPASGKGSSWCYAPPMVSTTVYL